MTHYFPLGFFRCLKTDEERGVCASSGVGGPLLCNFMGDFGPAPVSFYSSSGPISSSEISAYASGSVISW